SRGPRAKADGGAGGTGSSGYPSRAGAEYVARGAGRAGWASGFHAAEGQPSGGSRVRRDESGAAGRIERARRDGDARAGLRMGAAGRQGSTARRRASHRERAYRYGVFYYVGAG